MDVSKLKAYFINLANRKDRCDRMINILNRENITWEREEAVTINDETIKVLSSRFPQFELPYLACSESHANVWKKISNLQDEFIGLILEDDICFHVDWQSIVKTVDLPADWELFLFDCSYLEGWDFTSDGNCGSEGLKIAQQCTLADGYAIKPATARWLLSKRVECMERGEFYNNETLLMELQERNKSFTYFPKLILQRFDESDIQSQETTKALNDFYHNLYFERVKKQLYPDY